VRPVAADQSGGSVQCIGDKKFHYLAKHGKIIHLLHDMVLQVLRQLDFPIPVHFVKATFHKLDVLEDKANSFVIGDQDD